MVIKTTGYDQQDMINDILKLHMPKGIHLDPTYSKGIFYKDGYVDRPEIKSDAFPVSKEIISMKAENLSFDDGSIRSIMFDPPFIVGQTKKSLTGIMANRFHGFPYVKDLWKWYDECLTEFYRVLENKGVLVFKCQDTVSSGRQWLSHVHIINKAEELGFYTKDLFVLNARSRIIGHNHKNQKHARKFHCYFLVFEKKAVK